MLQGYHWLLREALGNGRPSRSKVAAKSIALCRRPGPPGRRFHDEAVGPHLHDLPRCERKVHGGLLQAQMRERLVDCSCALRELRQAAGSKASLKSTTSPPCKPENGPSSAVTDKQRQKMVSVLTV